MPVELPIGKLISCVPEVMTDLEQSKYQVSRIFPTKYEYVLIPCRTANGDSAYTGGRRANGTSWRSGLSTTSYFHTTSAG